MDVLICHLTRMSPPLICTAGLNLSTLRHVRPQPQSGHLKTTHLHVHGGVLRLARVVRFVSVTPTPQRPEVEDIRATFRTAQVLDEMPPADYWDRITRPAHQGDGSLYAAFGEDIKRQGLTHAVALGGGAASLGLIKCPAASVSLTIRAQTQYNKHPQVRAVVAPGVLDPASNGRSDLPVTDLRFYGHDLTAADEQAASDASVLLKNSRSVVLAMGLTRPFAKGAGEPMHWLQVNGVFPDVDPLWSA